MGGTDRNTGEWGALAIVLFGKMVLYVEKAQNVCRARRSLVVPHRWARQVAQGVVTLGKAVCGVAGRVCAMVTVH